MEKKASIKQFFLYSVINYIGTAIGVVSTVLIYPQNKELYGTISYVEGIAQLLFPIMVLGASQALIKFYPALDEYKKRQLFNYSIVSVGIISAVVFLGILLYNNLKESETGWLLYFAFPIALSLAFVELFRKQAQDLQKLAVPTLYEKLFPKIALPLVFILFLNHIIGVYESLLFFAVCYGLIFILTAIYVFKHYKPGFNYRFKTLFGEISRKEYFRYSLYAFAGSLGSLLAFRIDSIVIFNMISEEANGTFKIGSNLASTLQIPAVGLFALYAPIVSGYLKNDNFSELHVKYKEVARLLFFIGAVLYSCIFLGIDDLFMLMPTRDKLMDSIPVILVLGFSVLVNMATGFNSEIITYSKYYRFNLITILLLILLNISLNVYFVYAGYGILGVAYASFIAMALFNISKLIFIYKKFGLIPFDADFFKMAAVFVFTLGLVYFLPNAETHLVNLLYKVGLSFILNIVIVYKLELVHQVNVWIDKVMSFGRK